MKEIRSIDLYKIVLVCAIPFVLMFLMLGCSKTTDSNKPVEGELEVSKDITDTAEADIPQVKAVDMPVWTELSNMKTERCSPGMVALNEKIYVVGGWNMNNGFNILGNVEEYNPETDKWTTKADMLDIRNNFGIAEHNGYLYTIGGAIKNTDSLAMNLYMGSGTVEKYDSKADQWIKVQSLNGSPSYVASAAAGNKIYAIYLRGSNMVVEEYDPDTDIWKLNHGKTSARYGFSTAVVDDMIYLIGGTDAGGYQAVKTVDQYDPSTDTWTRKPDLSNPRAEHTVAVSDSKIYIIGGWSTTTDDTFLLDEYDPKTGISTAKTAIIPDKRTFQTSVSLDNRIYVTGGMNVTLDKAFHVYLPAADQ